MTAPVHRRRSTNMLWIVLAPLVALVMGVCSFMDYDDPRLTDTSVPSEQLVQGTVQQPWLLAAAIVLAVIWAYSLWRMRGRGDAP